MNSFWELPPEEFGRLVNDFLSPRKPISHSALLQGREGQLDRVKRALFSSSRSIFIYSPRGVGKTSLAHTSANEVLPADVKPILLSCDRYASAFGIIRIAVEELLGRKPIRGGVSLKGSFDLGPVSVEAGANQTPIPDPLDKKRFHARMNALKKESHGQIFETKERHVWYKFRVPILRGYCRLIARRYGIDLGPEYSPYLSKPYSAINRRGNARRISP